MGQVFKDGKWEEGKAAPQQLREDLRVLPSELITKDIDDPDRIHEIDPEHVADTYLDDYIKRAQGIDPDAPVKYAPPHLAEKYGLPPVGKVVKFTDQSKEKTQSQIDMFRLRVASVLLGNLQDQLIAGKVSENEQTRFYIWWPNNNVNEYHLKEGNPPPDSKRPKHLRGFQIHVDLNNPVPPAIVKDLEQNNPDLLESVNYG